MGCLSPPERKPSAGISTCRETFARLRVTQWQAVALRHWKFLLLIGVIIAVGIIWKVPQWQVAQWEGQIKEAKEIAKLQNDARTTLVQALGGAVLFIGLWFTWRNMRLAEKNIQITQETALRTFESTREGQITDRFTKAMAQLGEQGPEKLAVRLGGIYALERIAKASKADHWTIMEVLTAYVRETALWLPNPPKDAQSSKGDQSPQENLPTKGQRRPRPAADIQAILTVLARRTQTYKNGEQQRLNLEETDLRDADLMEARLEGASLLGAHLEGASLLGAHLEGADLREARLEGAKNLTVEQLVTAETLHNARIDLQTSPKPLV